MSDDGFEKVCEEVAAAAQSYLLLPPEDPQRVVLLQQLRELGLRPEHIARFLHVERQVRAQRERDAAGIVTH